MKKKVRTRTIVHRNHSIVQEVKWAENPHDGDGYEVRTTIKELPKYSDFDQLVWLSKDKQKIRIESAIISAKYHIDVKLKSKEPDLFEELGFN